MDLRYDSGSDEPDEVTQGGESSDVWLRKYAGDNRLSVTLHMRDKWILENDGWLNDDHVYAFMRDLEICFESLGESQASSLSSASLKGTLRGYREAEDNTIHVLHGGEARHWTVVHNLGGDAVVYMDAWKDSINRDVRDSLLRLFGRDEPDTVPGKKKKKRKKKDRVRFNMTKVNCWSQGDGWSCGYRALAMAWLMADGMSVPQLADVVLDVAKLGEWLLASLRSSEPKRPPLLDSSVGLKRVNPAREALFSAVTVTADKCRTIE